MKCCISWLAILLTSVPASAAVLKATVVGCSALAEARTLVGLQTTDRVRAAAFSRPLVATRACLDFAKGISIDIDERKPPLLCIRLPGDLSCYWTSAAAVDEHPSEKGAAGSGRHGGKRR